MRNNKTPDKILNKLRFIAVKASNKKENETVLEACAAYGSILYNWNQYYRDDTIENAIESVSNNIALPNIVKWDKKSNNKKVIFYDNFGLDTRGLVLIYLRALGKLGYNIVYVTVPGSESRQPEVQKLCKLYSIKRAFFENNSLSNKVLSLVNIFNEEKPRTAFFYSTPDDSAGDAAFCAYKGIVDRFQINLTDHAFWLGTKAFDYCLEFRDYGFQLSLNERGIPSEKLVILPYNPYFDKEAEFQGWPEGINNRKVIFSGGAIYKTLGDVENRFYKIVEGLLNRNSDAVFLYAGSGDDTELLKLASKFNNRVFHINERKDLFQLMQNSRVYLNTFPMLGGLMSQYAAISGRVPLTLQLEENGCESGILLNQGQSGMEFKTVEEVIEEGTRLLKDDKYWALTAEQIKKHVITDEDFKNQLNSAITDYKTIFEPIKNWKVNNVSFQRGYINRWNFDKYCGAALIGNNKLLKYFPCFVIKMVGRVLVCPKMWKKVINKLLKQ